MVDVVGVMLCTVTAQDGARLPHVFTKPEKSADRGLRVAIPHVTGAGNHNPFPLALNARKVRDPNSRVSRVAIIFGVRDYFMKYTLLYML